MTLDIYAADEQADHPVAVDRWAAWPGRCSEAEGITGDTEVSLLFIDEAAIAALNERFLDKDGPDRRPLLPHRGRGRPERPLARRGRHRARPPSRRRPGGTCCWATWSSARRWPPSTPSSTG